MATDKGVSSMSGTFSSKPLPKSVQSCDSSDAFSLGDLSVADLLSLRAQIDAMLPATSLQDLSLDKELVMQYQVAKALQDECLRGDSKESDKKAIINTTSATLQALVNAQKSLHNSEKWKRLEHTLLKAVRLLPREAAEAFLDEYAEIGKGWDKDEVSSGQT